MTWRDKYEWLQGKYKELMREAMTLKDGVCDDCGAREPVLRFESFLKGDDILGWECIQDVTGLKKHHIERAMGHFEFPEPHRVPQTGHTASTVAWKKSEIAVWMDSLIAQDFLATCAKNKSERKRGGSWDRSGK